MSNANPLLAVARIISGKHGVLKPAVDLNPGEQQRVRVILEPIEGGQSDRDAAVGRLKAGIAAMRSFSNGPLPKDEDFRDCRGRNVLLPAEAQGAPAGGLAGKT